jgi:hypothetical protein
MTTPETTISPPQVQPPAGGRGGTGGRGRGGRHRARGRGGGTKQGQGVPRASGFKGATPEMNGNVFECYNEQYDRRPYTKTVEALDAVIWCQCSEAMKAKIKSLTDYKNKTEANDCFWLLKQLKAVTLQFDEKRNVFVSLLEARTSLMIVNKNKDKRSSSIWRSSGDGWMPSSIKAVLYPRIIV